MRISQRFSPGLPVSAALAALLLQAATTAAAAQAREPATAAFTGSEACARCHAEIYARWKRTRMANVVRDPQVHPDAILGDFSKPNPLVKFTKDEIAFTYGSKWKQRYFTKRGDDYFVFPAQWDITNKVWRPYFPKAGADWWIPLYPDDPMGRPTGPLCDGCHSVNYNIKTKTVTEWNVGCERCHGAGAAHAARPSKANIVNPGRLDFVRANDICIQCHSQGRPKENPIGGKYYDWAVGFQPGQRLRDVWTLEEHRLGETTFTHYPDGTAHKNRMQGNDFIQSRMYERGIACFNCHDVHGTQYSADVPRPGNELCLTCHGPHSPMGPAGTLEEHTHHRAESAGAVCTACHMPKIEGTIANVNVRSHRFDFITPAASAAYKIPGVCEACHADKKAGWAEAQLAGWSNVSVWRMRQ